MITREGETTIVETQMGDCKTEVWAGGETVTPGLFELRIINWHTPPDREEGAVELTRDEVIALMARMTEWLDK